MKVFKFLFIGRILEDKGYFEYIKAAEKIKSEFDNINFSVLGSIDLQPNSISLETVLTHQKKGIIDYLGFHENIKKYIIQSDCIVLPSYHEGMSRVLIEAASLSKPIIASNIFGCKELVIDNVNGFLVKPKDYIDLYFNLRKFIKMTNYQRSKMGEKSREFAVKNLDVSFVIMQYINLIENN